MLTRYGEWGRDGTMYFAVRHGGHRLAEVVARIPGLNYQAAAQGMKRFGTLLTTDRARLKFIEALKTRLSTV